MLIGVDFFVCRVWFEFILERVVMMLDFAGVGRCAEEPCAYHLFCSRLGLCFSRYVARLRVFALRDA